MGGAWVGEIDLDELRFGIKGQLSLCSPIQTVGSSEKHIFEFMAHPQHMEVPGPGTDSIAAATPDPSPTALGQGLDRQSKLLQSSDS